MFCHFEWLSALILLSAQGTPLQERPAESKDYAIYNLILDNLPQGATRQTALIFNRTTTRDPSFRRSVLRVFPREYPDSALVDSLASGTGAFRPHTLDVERFGSGVRLIDPGRVRSFFLTRDRAWERFRAAYPGIQSFVQLSNVVYGPDGSTALVYASVSCGSLCGQGTLYFLTRDGEIWRVKHAIGVWVS